MHILSCLSNSVILHGGLHNLGRGAGMQFVFGGLYHFWIGESVKARAVTTQKYSIKMINISKIATSEFLPLLQIIFFPEIIRIRSNVKT